MQQFRQSPLSRDSAGAKILMHKIKYLKFPISHNSGFTLLEVIISLSIITLMIGLFLANYDAGNRSTNLALSTQQVVSDIRTAQNKALGSTIYGGSFPTGGWGAHFDRSAGNNTSYVIFADANGDKKYNAPDEAVISQGGQTISLPPYVNISNIVTNNSSDPNPSTLDITFLPPDPTTRIYGDGANTSSEAWITLKSTIDNRIATVTVNILGLIQAN